MAKRAIVDDAGETGRKAGIVLAIDRQGPILLGQYGEHRLDQSAGWAIAFYDDVQTIA